MQFNFGLKSSLLLIFFVHGLVYGFLLLRKGVRESERSSIWLAAFIWLCSLYIAPFMFGYAGWYAHDGYRETLFFIPFQQVLLLGPVLYFYTRSLLTPARRFTRSDGWHFVPAILYLLYSLIVFVFDVFVFDEFYFYADGRDKDLKFWYQALGWISMVAYLPASLRVYRKYRRLNSEWVSYADAIRLEWVRLFLVTFLSILLLRMLFFILNPEWGEFGRKFWYYLAFSVLFYYIAIRGYSHAIRIPLAQGPEEWEAEIPKKELMESDTFAPEEMEQWKERISQVIESNELFRRPTLTLRELAETLDIHPRTVSAAINQGFEMNFNDLINRYRVVEVQRQLHQGVHKQKTLLGIALDCGFNSKSTFNRAFKKHSGLSPGEYLNGIGMEP